MKLNRSLGISHEINALKAGNILGMLKKEFPMKVFEKEDVKQPDHKNRDRVFSSATTMLTMILTATQKDKSLKNSVQLYYTLHQQNKMRVMESLKEKIKKEREEDRKKEKKPGRPKQYAIQIPESLKKDISLNTAAYSKARNRVSLELTRELFSAMRLQGAKNDYTHFHGRKVLIGDGTYVQMQDTPVLRELYDVKHNGESCEGYPQGLIEVLIERGTGQIFDFRLASRHTSELALFYDMIDEVPGGSILLLDDLYNCFEIIAKCKRKGIDLVFPAKREKAYDPVEKIAEGDFIIKKRTPENRSKWLKENEKPGDILLRRIECKSPDGKDYLIYTTVLDKTISKDEFQLLYLTRWDIEIDIREIKTVMDINILRSKTPDMALKELIVALATYNLIRKVIYASIKKLPFSPKEDFIFKFYTLNQDLLVDKKGRVYSRWSPGRRRNETIDITTDTAKKEAKQKI